MSKTDEIAARERIVRATIELLRSAGRDAVTTRSVSAAARVQSPTIYRHFGDMRGLLKAAVDRAFADYLQVKVSSPQGADPVEDLRRAWDRHHQFGMTNPVIYALIYGEPDPDRRPAAVKDGHALLHGLLERIARAGRLCVSIEEAADMIHAGSVGVTLNLIAAPPETRNEGASAAVREAILSKIVSDAEKAEKGDTGLVARRAIALKAVLNDSPTLTPSETALLADWLDRLAGS